MNLTGDANHPSPSQREVLRGGTVLPAMPLALDSERRFDERRQRALVRYYDAAGAGGVAVGVHTTQFAIRGPEVGLYEPVLQTVAEALDEIEREGKGDGPPRIRIAGICGETRQAVREAETARGLGYRLGLLRLPSGMDEDALLGHAREVGRVLPLFGFYLQPAVGGVDLTYSFWRRFAEIESVEAIKVAPFDRYRTLDVVRAVRDSSRRDEIALYTGNDDNIVGDLLARYGFPSGDGTIEKRFVGGLLGHWAVWTKRAVELLDRIRSLGNDPVPIDLQRTAAEVTDANAAIFDSAHGFRGCIPGIHEVLRRQGLLAGTWCLDPRETLSPGQAGEIDRIHRSYPHLNDDDFVAENLPRFLD